MPALQDTTRSRTASARANVAALMAAAVGLPSACKIWM
eukprot:CAMPEP_0170630164 /NCGR_PEP_ID=MMETSP0224-20130122/33816_1 /TAXON_ID=285029 /ORGANISM="Togula jolla, Strain CCCM 725" /LENGTH=37 /DNA_ID= /DNA_START= /DNA_END= /DNA_ORIENTATION=